MKKVDLAKIALHEALHMVAAWRCGYILFSVTIEGRELGKEKCDRSTPFLAKYVSPLKKHLFFDVFDLLVVAYPAYGENQLFKEISKGSLLNCVEAAEGFLAQQKEAAFFTAAAKSAKKKAGCDPVLYGKYFFQHIREKLEGQLVFDDKAKRAARNLARELASNKTLSGRECALLFEKAYGGQPPGALPVREHFAGPDVITKKGQLLYIAKKIEELLKIMNFYHTTELTQRVRLLLLQAKFLIGETKLLVSDKTAKPGRRVRQANLGGAVKGSAQDNNK